MVEEAERPFPPVEEGTVNHRDDPGGKPNVEEPDETTEKKLEETVDEIIIDASHVDTIDEADEPADDHAPDTPFPASSSTGSDGETTGPSTAENSVSQAPPSVDIEPKQVVGGRASIPDELEPHQLARLQDLKESNA